MHKGYFYVRTNIQFWPNLAQFSLEWGMFQTEVAEKIKTHILYSIYSFSSKTVPFMRKCEKNILEPDRQQVTIWRLQLHSEYVVFIDFSSATIFTRKRLSVTFCAHSVSFNTYSSTLDLLRFTNSLNRVKYFNSKLWLG